MHWQFHGVFQKTLYTRKVADVTKLTDFTDLQTYGFVRLSQPRGPPAHARGLQHEALRRRRIAGVSWAGALRRVVPTRARARSDGAARPVRFVVAAQRGGVVGEAGPREPWAVFGIPYFYVCR